jgi:sporulation integral membrane protein YtvI
MNILLKKHLSLIFRIALIFLTVLGIYFVFSTIIVYLLPFILGWIIASMIQPLIHFFTTRMKFSRNVATLIALSIFILLTGSIIALIGSVIVFELTKLSIMIPKYSMKLYVQGTDFIKKIEALYIQLPPDIAQSIIDGLQSLSDNLTALIVNLISSLLSFISSIPGFFIFIIVTIISTFFMARDKRKILKFIALQIPKTALPKGKVLKNDLLSALIGYMKAQLILMSITFVESAVGLTIIGIDYSVLIALLISIIDALPILGSGSIYIPLILWNLFTNHYQRAIYLGVLYGIIILVRQLLEPKILGNQIGLYPLVTLISMYIGLKIFGVLGLIIGPVSIIVIMTLQKVDILPKWKQ